MDSLESLKEVYKSLAIRYVDVIMLNDWSTDIQECSKPHLLKMLRLIIDGDSFTNADKLTRLMGYIQGVLTALGLIKVSVERLYSRSLFTEVYDKHGIKQKTIDIN